MTNWTFEKAELGAYLDETEVRLRAVLKSPNIWHRVRQSTQRALEQVVVAKQQLSEQEAPL